VSSQQGIDLTMLAFAEAPPTFTIADGVQAARQFIRQLKMPPELLRATRTEDLVVGYA
jgi:hypothetical protein